MPNIDGLYTDLGGGQWAQNTKLVGAISAVGQDAQGNLLVGIRSSAGSEPSVAAQQDAKSNATLTLFTSGYQYY
jgi:hypothetical protein